MRYSALVVAVFLVTGLVSAQSQPAKAVNQKDTAQRGMSLPNRDAMSMCPGYKFQGKGQENFEKSDMMRPCMMGPHGRGWECGQGPDVMMRQNMMGPQCCGMGWNHRNGMNPCFMHCPPFFLFPHILALLMLLGLINILLTIIVSLDMARNKCFNGLWIPVLLIAGIPGSAIYALFRIGDRIQCKDKA